MCLFNSSHNNEKECQTNLTFSEVTKFQEHILNIFTKNLSITFIDVAIVGNINEPLRLPHNILATISFTGLRRNSSVIFFDYQLHALELHKINADFNSSYSLADEIHCENSFVKFSEMPVLKKMQSDLYSLQNFEIINVNFFTINLSNLIKISYIPRIETASLILSNVHSDTDFVFLNNKMVMRNLTTKEIYAQFFLKTILVNNLSLDGSIITQFSDETVKFEIVKDALIRVAHVATSLGSPFLNLSFHGENISVFVFGKKWNYTNLIFSHLINSNIYFNTSQVGSINSLNVPMHLLKSADIQRFNGSLIFVDRPEITLRIKTFITTSNISITGPYKPDLVNISDIINENSSNILFINGFHIARPRNIFPLNQIIINDILFKDKEYIDTLFPVTFFNTSTHKATFVINNAYFYLLPTFPLFQSSENIHFGEYSFEVEPFLKEYHSVSLTTSGNILYYLSAPKELPNSFYITDSKTMIHYKSITAEEFNKNQDTIYDINYPNINIKGANLSDHIYLNLSAFKTKPNISIFGLITCHFNYTRANNITLIDTHFSCDTLEAESIRIDGSYLTKGTPKVKILEVVTQYLRDFSQIYQINYSDIRFILNGITTLTMSDTYIDISTIQIDIMDAAKVEIYIYNSLFFILPFTRKPTSIFIYNSTAIVSSLQSSFYNNPTIYNNIVINLYDTIFNYFVVSKYFLFSLGELSNSIFKSSLSTSKYIDFKCTVDMRDDIIFNYPYVNFEGLVYARGVAEGYGTYNHVFISEGHQFDTYGSVSKLTMEKNTGFSSLSRIFKKDERIPIELQFDIDGVPTLWITEAKGIGPFLKVNVLPECFSDLQEDSEFLELGVPFFGENYNEGDASLKDYNIEINCSGAWAEARFIKSSQNQVQIIELVLKPNSDDFGNESAYEYPVFMWIIQGSILILPCIAFLIAIIYVVFHQKSVNIAKSPVAHTLNKVDWIMNTLREKNKEECRLDNDEIRLLDSYIRENDVFNEMVFI